MKNHYAVSAGHEVTLETAANILQDGGNAIDAAIAAYAAACIAEPCMASAGAGAFANIYLKGQTPILLDFFCQTPLQKNANPEFLPIPVDFGDATEMYYGGMGAIATPGAIAGLYEMHRRWGSIPMTTLLQPAVAYAKGGVPINAFQHLDLSLLHTTFDHKPRAQELFKPNGQLIEMGELLKFPELADFFDYLGREGADAFYQGEVAAKLVNDCRSSGGHLSMSDLKNYKVHSRKPVQSSYQNHHVFSNPLPAMGGSLMHVGLTALNRDLEAGKEEELINAFLEMEKMEKSEKKIIEFLEGRNRRGATSHFNVVDRWGNAVALTMSLGEGSGYFIPSTDIHMNNMLGEQSLVPNGWHTWKENVRMSSMMNPTLIFDANYNLKMVLGSGGASRIPGAIMQVIQKSLSQKKSLKEAIQDARIHIEYDRLDIEPGHTLENQKLTNGLATKIWKEASMFFGGVHGIAQDQGKWIAIGDSRRDGVAYSK